jgi:carbonic anhydrase
MGNLTQTLANIKPAVTAVSGFRSDRTSSNRAFVQAVTDKNVALTVQRIRQRSPILADMADNGGIRLVGAMYDVGTGKVTFL